MTVFRLVFPQQVLPNCLHTVPFSEQNVFFAGAPVLGTFLNLNNTIITYFTI